jgi:hypothetical protein
MRKDQGRHGQERTFAIRWALTHSSHVKSSRTSVSPTIQINHSVNVRSGPTSLSRKNSISKPPFVVEQRDASTVNTAVHLLWKFTTSEWPDDFVERTGVQVPFPTAGPVAPISADSSKADRE